MAICPLFVLPNIKAMRIQVSKVAGFSLFEMVYHIEPPDIFKCHYKDGSKHLNTLVLKMNNYMVVLCIDITYIDITYII